MHANGPIERDVNPEDFEEGRGSSAAGAPLKRKEIAQERIAVAPTILRLSYSADINEFSVLEKDP